jgi:hypothetical protein
LGISSLLAQPDDNRKTTTSDVAPASMRRHSNRCIIHLRSLRPDSRRQRWCETRAGEVLAGEARTPSAEQPADRSAVVQQGIPS